MSAGKYAHNIYWNTYLRTKIAEASQKQLQNAENVQKEHERKLLDLGINEGNRVVVDKLIEKLRKGEITDMTTLVKEKKRMCDEAGCNAPKKQAVMWLARLILGNKFTLKK